MIHRQKQVIQDAMIVVAIFFLTFAATEAGIILHVISLFQGFSYIGIFLSGLFFTSVFTTAPAIVMLGEFARHNNIFLTALIGGLGAVIGDYVIFRFVKGRVSEDCYYLISLSKRERFMALFRTKLFRHIVPFLGAIIIASPLPDEIGIAMLGMAKVKNRKFLAISFIFNFLGILAVGWLARAII